jgi:hypothetical protein
MKKIIFIFFTFSGIYAGFTQKPPEIIDSADVKQKAIENVQPVKIDSAAVKEKAVVRLYPNPAKHKVEIEIKGFEPGYVQVRLVDKEGNLVRDDKRTVFSGNEIIVLMFSERPGLYFLLLRQGDIYLRAKLIIQ